MDGDNTSAGGKRSRKQTSFFEVKEVHIKKAAVVEGAGIKLADNPHFCQELERVKGDSDVCKALHSLLFGVVGKKLEIKKNLRAFSGLPAGASKEEKKAKILDRKKVWTMSLIKEALGLFGLEKAGDKEVVVTRLVDYIAEPTYTKSASAPGSGKKRKSVGKGGKKSSKRSKKSSEKKKVAPSSYILFCKDSRAALKADQPELSMIEQTKLLGSMWNALDEEAKKPWVEKAAQAKQALLGGATVDDIDFGSDDGSDGEDGAAGSLSDGSGDEEEGGDSGDEQEEEGGDEGSDDGAEDDDFKALEEDDDE